MTQVSSSHQTLQCPQCSEDPPVWMHSSCESPGGTSSHFPLAFNGYLYFTSVSDSIKEKEESLTARKHTTQRRGVWVYILHPTKLCVLLSFDSEPGKWRVQSPPGPRFYWSHSLNKTSTDLNSRETRVSGQGHAFGEQRSE